jgi:hypothetical protein
MRQLSPQRKAAMVAAIANLGQKDKVLNTLSVELFCGSSHGFLRQARGQEVWAGQKQVEEKKSFARELPTAC